MTRDDIIRMAKESGVVSEAYDAGFMNLFTSKLIRFGALVASAERESFRESFRVVTAAETSAAILHEREACAIVCDDINSKYKWPQDTAERVASQWCADAIRLREKHD